MSRALSLLIALLAAPTAATAQARDPAGPATPLTGLGGATVAPAVLGGGALPADPQRPLSGTHRLGTVATSSGSLLLTGTFQSGRLVHVAAARGRTRVVSSPAPAALGRALDDWRPAQPAGLPSAGRGTRCGIEAARVEVPAAAVQQAAVDAGTYVSVAWVCGLRTDERWLFRVPAARGSAEADTSASGTTP